MQCLLKLISKLSSSLKLESKLRKSSLIAQLVNNLTAMQETLVRFLGTKDPLEKR